MGVLVAFLGLALLLAPSYARRVADDASTARLATLAPKNMFAASGDKYDPHGRLDPCGTLRRLLGEGIPAEAFVHTHVFEVRRMHLRHGVCTRLTV